MPHRDGELLVRRSLVEQGLTLMRVSTWSRPSYGASGIGYVALDQAAPFVKLIRTAYGRALKERASG